MVTRGLRSESPHERASSQRERETDLSGSISNRSHPLRVSVIVPVYNDASRIGECLHAFSAAGASDIEIIVVDDGSTDDSASIAAQAGARVLRLPTNRGPAAARNHGAREARGDILFFVDADVVVASGALDRITRVLERHGDVAAIFGSYDDRPRATGVVSQYRNLLHHFVHQTGDPEATTFWAGCGAVRRTTFLEVGGFDAIRFPRSSIEDIELGYRLRRAGHRILLDKAVQGTHLKRWTFRSLLFTDINRRAVPWSRLIIESGHAPDDLNLRWDQRVSAALVLTAVAAVAVAWPRPELLAVATTALIGVVVLNRNLYGFFWRARGPRFAALCIGLHFLYYLCGGLGYVWARLGAWARGGRPGRAGGAAGDRA
jgi:glycosyltransferase involved in cell wall biosynthesis